MDKTLLEVAHAVATDMHKAGGIDAQTMREFDVACLPTESMQGATNSSDLLDESNQTGG